MITFNVVIAFILGAIIGSVITLVLKSKSTDTNVKPSKSEARSADVPSKTLYVGNLPYRANDAAVRAHFGEHGQVISVRLMKDRNTGRRKGYGFVEVAETDVDNVINQLNDSDFQQRTLKVREANERSTNFDTESNAQA